MLCSSDSCIKTLRSFPMMNTQAKIFIAFHLYPASLYFSHFPIDTVHWGKLGSLSFCIQFLSFHFCLTFMLFHYLLRLLFLATHSIWKFLGQGLNLSPSCNVCHSCGKAGSLTHCDGGRIEPMEPQRQCQILNLATGGTPRLFLLFPHPYWPKNPAHLSS